MLDVVEILPSISSPEVETAAASGIFRSSGSPPWLIEECGSADVSELEFASADDLADIAIEVDETFTKRARWPGSVKIIVESTTFWCVVAFLAEARLIELLE